MRKSVLAVAIVSAVAAGVIVGSKLAAQPQPNPRQQPGAMITMYAPEQHDLYDGHYVMSAEPHLHGRRLAAIPWGGTISTTRRRP